MSKKKSPIQNHDPSLCWDCANATRPWRCPWVEDGTTIEGWRATPSLIGKRSGYPYRSYCVIACPKFIRDSYCGGILADEEHNHKMPRIDNGDLRALAEAIVERAIIDWDTLDRGRLKSIKSDGQVIHLNKVLGFFFSDWFGELLGTFSQRTPEWVRQQIGIPDEKTAAEVFHATYRKAEQS